MLKQHYKEEGLLPRRPASDYNIGSPLQPPSRSTDNGDDEEKPPPHLFSMAPAASNVIAATKGAQVPAVRLRRPAETQSLMSTTATPSVPLPHQMEKGSEKRLSRVNRIKKQGAAALADEDEFTVNPDDDPLPASILPGAFSVEGNATHSGRPSAPRTSSGQCLRDSLIVDSESTQFEHQIVAFLAPDADDQQVEARIAQKAKELLRRQMEVGGVIEDAQVNDTSSNVAVMKNRILLFMGILSVILIIAGVVVGGVLSSTSGVPVTPAPTLDDPLLDELRSLNATSDGDLGRFIDPKSPQSQALEWMRNDTIILSTGRSTQDLLQRYVLAVLFYATNGPQWDWSQPYLSGDNVCSWNNGSAVHGYGVYCRLDCESVDELVLSSNTLLGQLPSELGLLTNLQILDLGWNTLVGSIPSELGQLLAMTSLDISVNSLTGKIPTELGQLLSLEGLE